MLTCVLCVNIIDFNFLNSPGHHRSVKAPCFSPVLVHMDPMHLLSGDNMRVLQEKLEKISMARDVPFSIDGKVTKEACSAIICSFPTGMHVTGFDMEGVPHWNALDRSCMAQILAASQCLLDDDGVLVAIATKDTSLDLLQIVAAHNL